MSKQKMIEDSEEMSQVEQMPPEQMPEEEGLSPQEMLKDLQEVANSRGFQIYLTELNNKYNNLFRESLNSKYSAEERVMRLEQMVGIGYASNLIGGLINTMESEIAYREEEDQL